MNELTFDVGLAAKLKQAVIRNNITDLADIDWLCEGDNLANVRRVRLGHAAITVQEHVIDCDAQPYVPDGLSVEEHRKGGSFKWGAAQVELHLASGQKGDKYIEGNKLRKELASEPVLPANVLDYLLAHPHLIPEEWKGKYVFFWGTIYRRSHGGLCVRCLYWDDDRWYWSGRWLGIDWDGRSPAALRAS